MEVPVVPPLSLRLPSRTPHREARLRPEFAAQYPYIPADRWELAAVLADRVVAHILGRLDARFILGERVLDPAHFEFRGRDASERGGGSARREDIPAGPP